jgi:hypothetical protein
MTQLVRLAVLATALSTAATSVALGQRSRGTMGAPVITQQPAVRPAPPAPPPASRGTMGTMGTMYVPQRPGPTGPRNGDLPRIVTEPRRGGSRYGYGATFGGGTGYIGGGSQYDRGDRGDRRVAHRRPPYMTSYFPGARYSHRVPLCGVGCVRIGGGFRAARIFASFTVGYPFYIPIVVPYIYDATYVRYGDAAAESYVPESGAGEAARSASKLIVIGAGTAGGGDALTVETLGDSVKLSWLGAGRPAREVRLFVSDSAQRELASRSASPSSPNATFEIATLSAPVAFAGVSVTFTDGVTSTTLVPYRNGTAAGRRR